MKLPLRLAIIGVLATTLLSLTAIQPVSAQAVVLTQEQQQRIQANCTTIKNTVSQLHANDALLRVNRGQIYESMSTKLMERFNTRLSGNGLDSTGTVAVTNSYKSALETFRTDYQAYERQLSAVLRIDCTKQPSEFHAAIEDARAKRAKVYEDVLRLHRYIDDYRSAVNDFLINFERVSGGNS